MGMWFFYTVVFYSAVNMKFADKNWKSKKIQAHEDKCHMFSVVHGLLYS